MRKLAVKYYNKGFNCSQCIIKAFEEKYGQRVSEDVYKWLSAINTGLGVGTVCSALMAGIMVFGLVFDETKAARARLKLLAAFDAYFNSINCSGLNESKNKYTGCGKVIEMTAFFTENILLEEGFEEQREQ